MRSERNNGIDLLRVVAMIYVVMLHTMGGGGVLSSTAPGTTQNVAAWGLEIFAYGAVNIFALISGYVAYTDQEKRVNPANYIVLWCQVVALGLGATLVFKLIRPEAVSAKDFLDMCRPLHNGLYWYFTAYTGLFIFMPILNAGLRKCSAQTLKAVFLGIILLFSFSDFVQQKFILNNGYSVIWIMILYLLGGIVKKCEIGKRLKVWQAFLGIIALFLFTWYWAFHGTEPVKSQIYSYLSPTVLLSSILYLIGFSKLRIHPKLHGAIRFAAAGTFAAYILNLQRFIWGYSLAGRFAYLGTRSTVTLIVHAVGFSVAFVIASILIDHLRIALFKLLRIRPLADRLVSFFGKLIAHWT